MPHDIVSRHCRVPAWALLSCLCPQVFRAPTYIVTPVDGECTLVLPPPLFVVCKTSDIPQYRASKNIEIKRVVKAN